MKQIALYGIGNFGYALIKHLEKKEGITLRVYDRKPEVTQQLKESRTHPYLHKTVSLSKAVHICETEDELVKEADVLILAINSAGIKEVLSRLKPKLPTGIHLLNTAKALTDSGRPISEVVKEVMMGVEYTYSILAGGTIATDLFEKEPLGVDIACADITVSQHHCDVFQSNNLAAYPTTDVIGVEYASAFKNVVAILSGIIKGMGFSYGAQTHVISRAAYEVKKLIVNELGAQEKTFQMNSQCWGNDLWMSCTGNTRNRYFGELLGKGNNVDEALAEMDKQHKTVEGIKTVRVLPMFKSLKKNPYLYFVSQFCDKKADLEDLKKILFAEKYVKNSVKNS